jgi:hypothetical protein
VAAPILSATEFQTCNVEENFEEDVLACMARLSQIRSIIELDQMDKQSLFLVGSQSHEISGFMDVAEIEEFLCHDGGIISFTNGNDNEIIMSCSIHGQLQPANLEYTEQNATKTETLDELDPENFSLQSEIE